MPLDSGDFRGSNPEFSNDNLPSNHYEVLDVNRNASDEEIKKAYRKQLIGGLHEDKIIAMEDGPDKDIAKARLEALKEAFEVLTNRRKRIEYDKRLDNPNHKYDYANPFPGYNPEQEDKKAEEYKDRYEMAKVRLEMAEDKNQMQEIVAKFNEESGPVGMDKRVSINRDLVISLPEGDFNIVLMSEWGGYKQEMQIIEFPHFKIGEEVKVKRGSGEVEDGWKVFTFDVKNVDNKPLRMVQVIKDVDGGMLKKWVTAKELRKENINFSKMA